MKPVILASVLALSMPLSTAQEDPVEAPTETETPINLLNIGQPERVVEIIQDAGYRAKLNRIEDGQKFIESSANGMKFQIRFYGCTEQQTDCELLVFTTGFDFADPQDERLVARWNYERFTKAYLDEEGDPFIQLPVNILHGVTVANFEDTLIWFTTEMAAFMDHIGWNETPDDSAGSRIQATPT
ncbi:MAG: YbjN domain-containing protein [Pseudomonadota bacterium]